MGLIRVIDTSAARKSRRQVVQGSADSGDFRHLFEDCEEPQTVLKVDLLLIGSLAIKQMAKQGAMVKVKLNNTLAVVTLTGARRTGIQRQETSRNTHEAFSASPGIWHWVGVRCHGDFFLSSRL